jgi:hypothetical protein
MLVSWRSGDSAWLERLLLPGLIAVLILSAACYRQNPAGGTPPGKDTSETPKPTVTNFKPGPIHYVALGDSTGVGVGALRKGTRENGHPNV